MASLVAANVGTKVLMMNCNPSSTC